MDENETLEAQFARLKELAKEVSGSEVNLCLTANGVRLDDRYRIRKTDSGDTLAAQLDDVERLLNDDRFKGFAEATQRVRSAEQIAGMANELVKIRTEEFREAGAAFRHIVDNKPESGDLTQTVIGELATIERDQTMGEELQALIAENKKPRRKA